MGYTIMFVIGIAVAVPLIVVVYRELWRYLKK